MDQNIENYYKSYQKKSDSMLIRAYFELEDKLEITTNSSTELKELEYQKTAIKEVVKERELNLEPHIKARSKSKKIGETSEDMFKSYMKDGIKAFIIGVVIFAISLVLLNQLGNNVLLLIGIIAGGIKMIQGFIIISVGLFMRVWYAR